jgi:hypothetical protein
VTLRPLFWKHRDNVGAPFEPCSKVAMNAPVLVKAVSHSPRRSPYRANPDEYVRENARGFLKIFDDNEKK